MDDPEATHEPRAPRMPADHPVRYRPRGSGMDAAELGRMVDISESGTLIAVGRPVEHDAVLELEIAAHGELIPARGRVARVLQGEGDQWALGLTWTGIATESLYSLLYSR